MPKSYGGHRNGSPDAGDTLTPTRLAEIGGSIPISQVQELRKIPSALPSLFPPSAPASATVTYPSTTSARLAWTAPADNGGSAVLGYKVRLASSDGTVLYQSSGYDSSPYTATGLTQGNTYSLSVKAVNAYGESPWLVTTATLAIGSPTAPTGLSATAGNGQINLSWSAPSDNGGAAIVSYSVEYTPSGGSATVINTGFVNTSYTLTGLSVGTTYSVRVAASNGVAALGPYSTAASATTFNVPTAPTGLAGTAGDQQVALAWTAPSSNGGSAITDYVVEYTPSGGSAQTVSTGNTATIYTLTGLTNGTAYTIRVAAVNSVGQGPYSASGSVTPAAASPGGLSVVSGSPTGAGTGASPYLVPADADPAPIYQATGPGRLNVSYSGPRLRGVCGKGVCTYYRFNDAVWFSKQDGSFFEKVRTNFVVVYCDANWDEPRNKVLAMSAATFMGQQLQCRTDNQVGNYFQAALPVQPSTARLSFTPQDANFSITSIGSRAVLGNGTAEEPYITATQAATAQNERTLVFRANGSGVVCIADQDGETEPVSLCVGGTANSFSGASVRSSENFWSANSDRGSRVKFAWLNDGEIFSLAYRESSKGGSWFQERPTTNFPIIVWAAPTTTSSGLWLMNYTSATNSMAAHAYPASPTLWQGAGTSASPASMPTWTKLIPQWGHAQNIFCSRSGTLTFDYQLESQACSKGSCSWRGLRVLVSKRPGARDHGAGSYWASYTFATATGSGSASISVPAFSGVNFQDPEKVIPVRITNLVFTPS